MFIEAKDNIEAFTDRNILPCILRTLNSHYKQENKKRPNGNQYHQFLWCVAGEGYLEIDNKTYLLTKGKGFFSRRGVPHKYYSEKNNFYTAWITFNGLDELLNYFNIFDYFIFDVPYFANEFICELDNNFGSYTIFTRSSKLYGFIIKFMVYILENKVPFCEQVNTYLENNFKNQVSLDSIAEAIGISKYRLCHKYSEECNKSVMDTLKHYRLSNAKQLLATTNYSINEIAKMCGFVTSSYFGKIFKNEFNITPKQYRILNK